MNKVLMSLLSSAFILTGISYAQNPPPAAPPVAASENMKTVASTQAHHERHPELHKAMRKLRGAKHDLEKAAQDYGGHKAKAMEAIDQALGELKEAMEADKS